MTAGAIIVHLNFLIYINSGKFCRACDPMEWIYSLTKVTWTARRHGTTPSLTKKDDYKFPPKEKLL